MKKVDYSELMWRRELTYVVKELLKGNRAKAGIFEARIREDSLVLYIYTGDENSRRVPVPLCYITLEGLQPGTRPHVVTFFLDECIKSNQQEAFMLVMMLVWNEGLLINIPFKEK